ncbi:EscU/YscU/HrcU family type III secretion system export apparatus switch protein [Sporolactobacillus shoreicorticis]|uniref:EscU/YscU/HrcU family type III secretion system export apparatus switch protein n=1 Tax=Sporolactobacillus shoreicorticis TaxID=1923877 RepID=A0ABW5SB39_9BACL|nr:EscU/YscU/HrcU family type III secretion system export apparatus switch protein [Sporolactobacillus shoreicorticis]MCO7126008.1 EscU/YscU/HrcU family type III secretion system export apparatus switch protein [Sporolactobacillus shoreicorticis]
MTSEKRKKAVALTYINGSDQAPHVSAKGEGEIAQRIIDQARKHDIPIQQDPALVSMLGKLDLNQMIPQELYQTVAEIFAFIYTIDEQAEKKTRK